LRISAIASPTFINSSRRNYILDSRGAYNPVARGTADETANKRVRIPVKMAAAKGISLNFHSHECANDCWRRDYRR
jgi:hypothetical protein